MNVNHTALPLNSLPLYFRRAHLADMVWHLFVPQIDASILDDPRPPAGVTPARNPHRTSARGRPLLRHHARLDALFHLVMKPPSLPPSVSRNAPSHRVAAAQLGFRRSRAARVRLIGLGPLDLDLAVGFYFFTESVPANKEKPRQRIVSSQSAPNQQRFFWAFSECVLICLFCRKAPPP